MGSCNTARNEKGGKDMLLKICKQIIVTIIDTQATITASAAHGLAVGDIVRFITLDTLNDVVTTAIYWVITAPTSTTFTIAASPGGTAIVFSPGVVALTIDVFTTLGGLRSKGNSFSADSIDVSNHGSNQWKELLDQAGMKSVAVSGSGVYTSADNFRAMEADTYLGKLQCFAFLESITGRVYYGCFKVSSLEATGEYDGDAGYSMSADSSGEIKIFQAA